MYTSPTVQTHTWHNESSDSNEEEIGRLQKLLMQAQTQLKSKDEKIDDLTLELDELSKVCADQDDKIQNLHLEVHKLKSTLNTVQNILQNPNKYTVRHIHETF
jgi:peptidoglycan hydrolase CwlO-like protein